MMEHKERTRWKKFKEELLEECKTSRYSKYRKITEFQTPDNHRFIKPEKSPKIKRKPVPKKLRQQGNSMEHLLYALLSSFGKDKILATRKFIRMRNKNIEQNEQFVAYTLF